MQHRSGMTLEKKDKARGARLKALRVTRKLTQKKLAMELEVDIGTISRWERGEVLPIQNIEKLCRYFKVDPEYITFGVEADNVETYPALKKYEDWLRENPHRLARLPEGALETIRTIRLRLPREYEPEFYNYLQLHGFMEGLYAKKRSPNK